MTPKTGITQTLAALLVGGAFIATQASADAPDALGVDHPITEEIEESYVTSALETVTLITGLGECLRLGGWNDEDSLNACEGIEDVAEAEPEPEPEPVAAPEPEPILSTAVLDTEALFDTNQSALTPQAEENLGDLLVQLERFDDIFAMSVVGHTDSRGSESYNQTLSEARAQSVADFLSGAYPDVDINATGVGETTPVATNSTPEGRQQNRRVEVNVTARGVIQN